MIHEVGIYIKKKHAFNNKKNKIKNKENSLSTTKKSKIQEKGNYTAKEKIR